MLQCIDTVLGLAQAGLKLFVRGKVRTLAGADEGQC